MEEEIRRIKQVLAQIAQMIVARGGRLSPELSRQVNEAIQNAQARISQLRSQQPIPQGAENLYVLAGGQPEAFQSYMRTISDPRLRVAAEDEGRIANIQSRLGQRITMPAGEQAGGIPRAQLSSSNIYGFAYDPRSLKMYVKFNGKESIGSGPVYEYEGVPPQIFKLVKSGAVPAKTSGSNRWGMWWKSKSPSLGSSVSALLVKGAYPYQKVA